MKWMQLLGTAVVLCGAVLLSACGGGEVPASTTPPAASSEAPAVSQPAQPEAPSSSEPAAPSASAEPAASSEETKPENKMVIQYGTLVQYDTGDQKEVVLPSGKFTKIKSGCFQGNTKLESIVIPEGVTEIGALAFSGCFNLKSVTLPKTLKKIGSVAFEKCENLTEVDFTKCNGLTIEVAAFQGSGLRQVILTDNVYEIGTNAFVDCKNLTYVQLDGLTTVPEQAFARCASLRIVRLGPLVSKIDGDAFLNCPLETIYYSNDWDTLVKNSDLTNKKLLESVEHYPAEN